MSERATRATGTKAAASAMSPPSAPATRRRRVRWVVGILGAAVVVTVAAPFIGASTISPWGALSGTLVGADAVIFWQMRVPRVLLAFFAGAGLAVSGMAFQALFRNPLATPFTLGVSSGASLGAAAYVMLGLPLGLFGVAGISVAAFCGAVLAITVVYGLTRLRRGFSTATMLLAGVALSFFFSSLILFMQYAADMTHSFRILRWLMGSLDATGYGSVLDVLPFVVGGGAIIVYLVHELNLLTTGEDIAASRGVNVSRAKKTVFLAVSLMVGGIVATCGPIGFVGMMVPHICRLLVGWEHRLLVPVTLAFGGAFLVFCDCISRTLLSPTIIPVGVITALLGGPFFLWLLLGGSSEGGLLRGGRR